MNWKQLINGFLNRFGYNIVPWHGSEADSLYIVCTPYNYRTFAPWFGKEFQSLYEKAADHTVVREDRCYVLHQLARYATGLNGHVAECGVFKGGTAFIMAEALRGAGMSLRLYDTFSGMPESAEKDPSGHKAGEFGDTSLKAVQDYLSDFDFVQYFPGFIPDTFDQADAETYSLVHVDVDLYQSVYDCCVHFYPRLVPGGVMVFDDYGFEKYIDAGKKAVDDFFANKPEVTISLHTGQCVVIKLPEAGTK